MGSFPHPRNGIVKIDYEFILLFKKHGKAPVTSKKVKQQSKMTVDEWNKYFAGHWNIPGEKQNGHLAMFPEEIPRRLIRMFSFVNDTVLDPFLGSGTTTLAAKNLGRNSIGYEINPAYLPVIKKKLGLKDKGFFDEFSFELAQNREDEIDWKAEIRKLPYIFKDPVKFDKKVDPRRLQFGSKINHKSGKRETYYQVKDVISPVRLIVGDGLKVRLLGIKEKKETRNAAVEFLRNKTDGQRVFMKFDAIKHDEKDNLLCYLYLQNKTFLNAHLIKKGLVEIDSSFDNKLAKRFFTMSEGK